MASIHDLQDWETTKNMFKIYYMYFVMILYGNRGGERDKGCRWWVKYTHHYAPTPDDYCRGYSWVKGVYSLSLLLYPSLIPYFLLFPVAYSVNFTHSLSLAHLLYNYFMSTFANAFYLLYCICSSYSLSLVLYLSLIRSFFCSSFFLFLSIAQ